MSGQSTGGAIDDLTHEEILSYLEKIEAKQSPKLVLISEREESDSDVFPYREKYLETVLSRGEPNENFETMLAQLYIEKLFSIQNSSIKDDVLLPERDQPLRTKLNKFLREKEHYNTSHLLSLVRGSWMK